LSIIGFKVEELLVLSSEVISTPLTKAALSYLLLSNFVGLKLIFILGY